MAKPLDDGLRKRMVGTMREVGCCRAVGKCATGRAITWGTGRRWKE